MMIFHFFGKGLEKKMAVLATIFILLSCQKSEKDQIQGDWYSFDKDSVYFELYINDTIIVLNNEHYGPVGYDYEVMGDKLIVSNAAGMERVWAIEEISPETMKLTDSLETFTYSRLRLTQTFFNSLADSSSFREFSEIFKTRHSLHSKK